MPNLDNAKKALRQAQKRTIANNTVKRAYKIAMKNVTKASEKGEANVAELIVLAQKKLDKAAKKGVLKKNTAARKLSRLVKRVAVSTKK